MTQTAPTDRSLALPSQPTGHVIESDRLRIYCMRVETTTLGHWYHFAAYPARTPLPACVCAIDAHELQSHWHHLYWIETLTIHAGNGYAAEMILAIADATGWDLAYAATSAEGERFVEILEDEGLQSVSAHCVRNKPGGHGADGSRYPWRGAAGELASQNAARPHGQGLPATPTVREGVSPADPRACAKDHQA